MQQIHGMQKRVVLTRQKAGGSGSETIEIPIPLGSRTLMYSNAVQGATAITNSLNVFIVVNDGVINISQSNGTAIFNAGTAGARVSTVSANFGAKSLRWQIQANAVTACSFYLEVWFYSL